MKGKDTLGICNSPEKRKEKRLPNIFLSLPRAFQQRGVVVALRTQKQLLGDSFSKVRLRGRFPWDV